MSMEGWEYVVFGLLIVGSWIAWFVRRAFWTRAQERHLDRGRLLGGIKDWEVRLVADPRSGRPRVGIAITSNMASYESEARFFILLSGRQARQLAEWLRVAAAPGKTVALARSHVAMERKRAATAALSELGPPLSRG